VLVAGTRLGPYEVVGPLGAGGMGEVYRARDTRLGRDVAIKVLAAEFAADPERLRRFEKEARATGSLNHPNILAIYDVGSARVSLRGAVGPEAIPRQEPGLPRPLRGLAVTEEVGEVEVHYLVEELLEGQTLREVLKAGPVPVRRAVEVAVQVASGLAAAHGKGVVHRDLKPENLFVTAGGHVKILDFGLAKLVEAPLAPERAAEASTLVESTEVGAVLGTVGYMAPEQVRGLAVDHRADIFSLGCVLYEMLSGQRAFKGPTPADTMSAILSKDPPPLSGPGSDVPPALQGVVGQCLEKRPEDRFSSAHDLALALRLVSGVVETPAPTQVAPPPVQASRRRVVAAALVGVALLAAIAVLILKLRPAGSTAGATALTKIVVLPFENLGAPEDAYFASGMAEEITSRLANVQGLGVISRTTAAQYEHTRKTVKEIGSDLGVDFVLEGSVRWEHGQGKESRVRITPQLIRVADDTHVWADRYDRVLADVFAIQSEVAESAVKAMGVTLLPPEQARLKEISTNDLEAYDLYLRGMELFGRGEGCEMFGSALEKFQEAVDRDPRFAQALAMTASIHLAMYWIDCDQGQEHLAKGKEAAERAVELRPDLAEPHIALGEYFFRGLKDCPRALEEYARALEIQPHNSYALLGTGFALRFQWHLVEAAKAWEKGLELDPKNVHLLHHLAVCYVWAGRYADADRLLGRVIALSPQWSWTYAVRANLQVQWHGDVDRAQAILDEASHVAGINESFPNTRRWLALLRGDYPEVLRLLEAQEPQLRDDPATYALLLLSRGQVQMLMGQGDLARRSYEAARVELEKKVAEDPNDAESHSSLGVAYAGLGRRADAVREAKLGCDLQPMSKEPLGAFGRLEDLARVYTMVGQPGEAIAILGDLVSREGDFTTHVLRLDPTWDPLRSDPRFAALLKKHEVKP